MMRLEKSRSSATRCAIATLVFASACADVAPTGALSELLFLSQNEPPAAVMDALFQGTISVDSRGCLRLDTQDAHTVVWPHGFALAQRAEKVVVVDGRSREIGAIGGSFKFGGGEIQMLHDGVALSSRDRERALASCPGRYWIVGDVP